MLNKYKMGHLGGNFTPVLYIGRKVPKGECYLFQIISSKIATTHIHICVSVCVCVLFLCAISYILRLSFAILKERFYTKKLFFINI